MGQVYYARRVTFFCNEGVMGQVYYVGRVFFCNECVMGQVYYVGRVTFFAMNV